MAVLILQPDHGVFGEFPTRLSRRIRPERPRPILWSFQTETIWVIPEDKSTSDSVKMTKNQPASFPNPFFEVQEAGIPCRSRRSQPKFEASVSAHLLAAYGRSAGTVTPDSPGRSLTPWALKLKTTWQISAFLFQNFV